MWDRFDDRFFFLTDLAHARCAVPQTASLLYRLGQLSARLSGIFLRTLISLRWGLTSTTGTGITASRVLGMNKNFVGNVNF
jgi:hypothetical protein